MRYGFTATALVLLSLTVIAVAQNQPLKFEVASVKRNVNGARCPDQFNASGVNFCDANLRFLIAQAYQVSVTRVVSPTKTTYDKGVLDDDFDIIGKTERPATKEQVWSMVQALLSDRFRLAIHRERRPETVYELVRIKDTGQLHSARRPDGPSTFSPDVNGYGFTNQTMEKFCRIFLTGVLEAQVTDHTGLPGAYDFLLKADFPEGRSSRDKDDAAPVTVASIIASVQELGLKLQAQKGAADYIVVDHAEKPDAN